MFDLETILNNSYVVTDDPTRFDQLCKTFSAVGLSPLPKIWKACRIENEGSLGNAISQYSLVRYAQQQNLPWIVVFEDDAVPSNDAKEELVRAFNERPDDALCLSLGWSADSDPRQGEFSKSSEHRRVYGSHAYVLFGQDAYSAYVDEWERNGRADIVIGNMAGSYLNRVNMFAQHAPNGGIHLPAGWTINGSLEEIVDGEIRDRYSKSRSEIEKIKRKNQIHVAYTVDVQGRGAKQFCDQLLASVFSILRTKEDSDSVFVHILYGSIPSDLMGRLYKLRTMDFDVEFIKIKKDEMTYMQTLAKGDPTSDVRTWSGIVFARIWLPLAIKGVDRILYLDSDTMVRRSLSDLWKTDLNGNLLGMVKGSVYEYGFNSGVILMDAKTMREDSDMWQRMAVFLNKNAKKFYCPDQTAINEFFDGKILELDRKYNFPPTPANNELGYDSAVIYHWYNGPHKPERMDRNDLGKSFLLWNETEKAAEAATD